MFNNLPLHLRTSPKYLFAPLFVPGHPKVFQNRRSLLHNFANDHITNSSGQRDAIIFKKTVGRSER